MSAATLELLSPRAFGEALGVSRQAVQKAIKTGRLSAALSKDEHTGHHLVELAKGREEWEAWTDPTKRRPGRKGAGRPKAAAKGTASMFESPQEQEHKKEQITHARASTERVQLDAQLKQLELDQLRGNLVDKRETQREAFRLARLVRERLQAIPDRISASLAAFDKPAQVHQLLAEEIAKALQSLDRRDEDR